jgi:hypothetical protein
MSSNVEALLRDGISASKAGRKAEARDLLLRVVELDEQNEMAWLWLSGVVEGIDDQITCLENVLAINPNNDKAAKGLEMLRRKSSAAASSGNAVKDDPFANANFSASKTPASVIDDDELPSSVEWAAAPTETSSASSQRVIQEPSSQDYDDWLSRLNIGKKADEDDDDDDVPEMNFSTPFANTFNYDEDDEEEDILGNLVASSGDRISAPQQSISDLSLDDFDEDDDALASAPGLLSQNRGKLSPAREPMRLDDDDDDDMFISSLDDDAEGNLDDIEAGEFFRYIPDEIKATRLPGTNERYPILVIVLFVVLVLANVGAVAMLIMRLPGNT